MKTGMKLTVFLSAIALFAAGILAGQNKFGKPKSILHIVTVKWQDGTTEAQKAAALKGVEKMAAAIPGMRNVWLKTIMRHWASAVRSLPRWGDGRRDFVARRSTSLFTRPKKSMESFPAIRARSGKSGR